ncbi:MAG TPA: LytTR family DNA-binding domain-containing protein [Longimicrobium sp.]
MTELPRVLIVDDERLARLGVRQLLEEHDVEVVGECDGGEAAIAAIRRLAPDLVFLDVQMPEVDGFAVVERVGLEKMPAVVFVTAFDAYAVRAFDVHAVDYVLKPIDEERFHESVARALARLRQASLERIDQRVAALASAVPSALEAGGQRIVVKEGGRISFVRHDEIDWAEADGNYVRLHVGAKSHLVRGTMDRTAEVLGPGFIRIGRSAVVAIGAIRHLEPYGRGTYSLLLRSGEKLVTSRLYRGNLERLLRGSLG